MKICDDFCFNFNTNSLLNKGRFRMDSNPLKPSFVMSISCYKAINYAWHQGQQSPLRLKQIKV